MFTILLWNVICVFLLMAPGFISARVGWLKAEGIASLARVFLVFIYPCLIFSTITREFTLGELLASWRLPASSFGIMVVGCVIGTVVALLFRVRRGERRRAFLFQATINNYSFFPMAIVTQLWGAKGVALLIFSSLGGELALWTLGVLIVSGRGVDRRSLRHLVSPPLVGMYAAAALLAVGAWRGWDATFWTRENTLPYYLHNTATLLGSCTVPLAMIISGARLARVRPHHLVDGALWLLAALRMVGIPLVCFALLGLMPLEPEARRVLFVVAVMPVSLASMVISELYGGDKDLVNGSVLVTHLLALVTVPALLAWFLSSA
jgi:predicted permease